MIAKLNVSKRTITTLTAFSIMLTLLCLLYVTNRSQRLQQSSSSATESYAKAIESNATSLQQPPLPIKCIENTADRNQIKLTKQAWNQCLDAGATPEYYLSIVIVTRMDDYAGNQHHRFQNFIDSAYLLAEHSEQKIELLIIEWNPSENKRRILDAFRFRRSKYLNYRIITVSNKIHKILPNKGNAPLHEFEGKNVGIRFARGEYVVCTNQDDIWSHNFINAVKSRVFEKDTIYVQYQSAHNIHENLPPSIVNLEPFPDDETLYKACRLADQDWGHYTLPAPVQIASINADNYWYYGDQSGDFTMAHRDTWKDCKGYRETGGVAWMDMEFILTAVGTFDKKLVYSGDSFACHQEHPNEWEKSPERHTESLNGTMIEAILHKKAAFYNQDKKWGLQHVDIWKQGLECFDFNGGLCW
ncbi:uncharacterized protein ATC70_007987 [Mucor velutinosus]|uniref:Uncharacterized protein n=1 Tax=Mucor velutinosus TaxID=708070 RepID=A0AAN7HVT8_9FUNG|nr:hypothetical protein ATC70_007987 [Mucor velutinosus]